MNIALTDNRQARVPYDDLREWIVEADKLGELIRAPGKAFGNHNLDARRYSGRSGLPTGQSSFRERAAPCESCFGCKRDPPEERSEKYLHAVPSRSVALLSRDWHQHSGFAGPHELIGRSRKMLVQS